MKQFLLTLTLLVSFPLWGQDYKSSPFIDRHHSGIDNIGRIENQKRTHWEELTESYPDEIIVGKMIFHKKPYLAINCVTYISDLPKSAWCNGPIECLCVGQKFADKCGMMIYDILHTKPNFRYARGFYCSPDGPQFCADLEHHIEVCVHIGDDAYEEKRDSTLKSLLASQ